MKFIILTLCALTGYILGSLNFSVMIGKIFFKKDIRKEGSKSAGATNTLRILGKGATAGVVIGDFLKGILAYIVGSRIGGIAGEPLVGASIAGIMAVIGHIFPLFFKFKGGKGVLTSLSVSFMINWKLALITLLFSLLIMIFTRYVSLGSILGCTFNAIIIFIFDSGNFVGGITVLVVAVISILKHHQNIKRLICGNENKIGK